MAVNELTAALAENCRIALTPFILSYGVTSLRDSEYRRRYLIAAYDIQRIRVLGDHPTHDAGPLQVANVAWPRSV